ncbi:type I polyketide synthase [Hyphomonas pacifica]|uniref:type I polyketide synthase n=1 Tax=Hyphomonas pacifica TaxID=1280941 RepID=UPI000DC02247|nr:type I polyketide synthase [Hyphomonas pacifica]RAN35592.1 hypothetical protein HY11_13515 [Hyphomonas pacifica]
MADTTRSIAIIGMACRFPGRASTPASFWNVLREGRDVVGEIPADRMDVDGLYDDQPAKPGHIMTRYGGYLENIDRFDAGFFHISPREAERMDPQQRIVLETAWEALEDAGLDVRNLSESRVGVYVGQWLSDFEMRLLSDPTITDFEMTTGSGRYTTAGRVSHFLGLMGPSLTLDTACSSSLTAVHLAMQSLRSGETDMALAAGVNLILSPHITIGYSQSRMMAPDGRCKFGDASGNGYVRSEGAGVVLLKRLDRALQDGDEIHAIIRGSAINNDGHSSGSFGTPSRKGQEALLRAALLDADVSPASVDYVEAHGTGTRMGDPVELGALSAVMGKGRSTPLRVGSVKTNIGHTEGAAGMAGLLKTTLALKAGCMPASLHFQTPNPDIDWESGILEIPARAIPWTGKSRYAGVSGFGIAGSNAHLVLQSAPAQKLTGRDEPQPSRPAILPLSAESEDALRALAGAYADKLKDIPDLPVHALAAAAAMRRTALTERAAFVHHDRVSMIAALEAFSGGADSAVRGRAFSGMASNVVFAAPGQGGQWIGMARTLMSEEPAFREALEQCERALSSLVDWSLTEQISLNEADDGWRLHDIAVIQPTLAALAISYARLWSVLGVTPAMTVGHSMGEVAAAAISGILSLEDAMHVVVARSRLMARTSGNGGMALVELSDSDLLDRLAPFHSKLDIAANNSPRASVISGNVSELETVLESLTADGIFCRRIKVDVASHGPQMADLAPQLAAELSGLAPRAPHTPMISTVHGKISEEESFGASYWARNLREPVRFMQAIEAAITAGATAYVELGPNPVLLTSIEQTLSHHEAGGTLTASERRDRTAMDVMTESLATLWANGTEIDWAAYAGKAPQGISLPHYPWQGSRYWHEAAERHSLHQIAHKAQLTDQTRQLLHQIDWIKTALPSPRTDCEAQNWLVIGGRADDSEAISNALQQSGIRPYCCSVEDAETTITDSSTWQGVIIVAPKENAGYLPVRLLNLVRGTAQSTCHFVFVTQGAVSVGEGDQRVSVGQAPLIGAMRVTADEHPEFSFRMIDGDPATNLKEQAADIAALALSDESESEIALRAGDCFVPRLHEAPEAGMPSHDFQVKPGAAYLITGGLSSLGLRAATVLAKAGARHIILLSRRGLPPRSDWQSIAKGSETADRIAGVLAIESAGASIETAALDISDESAVNAFLKAREAEMRPTIHGVIHLATSYETHLAANTSKSTFNAALGPKLEGARLLDRLLPELDLFLLYSSTMSFVPHHGLAGYAAANCGLDALAADRIARGKAAMSIAWGPWKDLGRAALGHVADEFDARGELSLEAEEGDALIGWLLGRNGSGISAFHMDWPTFQDSRAGRTFKLFEDLLAQEMPADNAGRSFEALPLEERTAAAKVFVPASIAKVLKLGQQDIDLNRPLGDLGLNSLMGIELRNALEKHVGRPLPATLAWTYPTARAIVDYLCTDTIAQGITPTNPTNANKASTGDYDDSFSEIEDMSEEDALAALLGDRK